jgi:hypothetical protein
MVRGCLYLTQLSKNAVIVASAFHEGRQFFILLRFTVVPLMPLGTSTDGLVFTPFSRYLCGDESHVTMRCNVV